MRHLNLHENGKVSVVQGVLPPPCFVLRGNGREYWTWIDLVDLGDCQLLLVQANSFSIVEEHLVHDRES